MSILSIFIFLLFGLLCLANTLNPLYWEVGGVIFLGFTLFSGYLAWQGILFCGAIIAVTASLHHFPQLKNWLGQWIYQKAIKTIPKLSSTEEEALNAGNTWIEKSLFMGQPDWQKLYSIPKHALSSAEQHFLDNEVQTLCGMLNEWQVSQAKDLPQPIWQYLKDKGFFGLVIDKQYGGLGFSAKAHSDIVMKIATRSTVAAVTVMVPNSLGPGELLSHYGTQAQKDKYLPALAKGEHIPCFALTEPTAGSDATSITASAIVQRRKIGAADVLGLSLTFNKRWITLAPVATLIGLAVDLKDPEGLLTEGREGITCVLIPRETKGLNIGNRHIPCNQYFMNGTLRGKDVFVPIDAIIGGEKNAGAGWRMLVECLSIGRSISLPALGAAASSVAYLSTSAYAKIRRQFNTSIGQFEGIEEKLAHIAGLSYLVHATRQLTVAAVDEKKKPSVASAITKYFNTENGRTNVIDAVDVHGGRAVVNGPRNYLINLYQSMPISVTVEGANIMTRNLLIFGQGAMACHPYLRQEFYALSNQQPHVFSQLVWQHAAYFLQNFAKSLLATWTGGRMIKSPKPYLKREHQKLTQLSYAFSWISDVCLMVLGGNLKRKERLSARLGDALSHLYMAAATLKMLHGSNNEAEQLHAKWALTYCFYHTQKALLDLAHNFPIKPIGWLIKWFAFPFGQTMKLMTDKPEQQLAQLTMKNQAYREALKRSIYLSGDPKEALDKVEYAFQRVLDTETLFRKVKGIGRVPYANLEAFLQEHVQAGTLTELEKQALLKAELARWDAIQVDEFAYTALEEECLTPVTAEMSDA